MVFKKPNWGPPPPGYIAGLGRGATGFSTRADLGSAAPTPGGLQVIGAPPGLGRGRGRGNPNAGPPGISQINSGGTSSDQVPNDSNFDQWSGYNPI